MCNFKSDHEVMVCDVAIASVRSHLMEEVSEVEFVTVPGQGTLVRALGSVDATLFRNTVRAAIEIANQAE
jgi:hypothetical protein